MVNRLMVELLVYWLLRLSTATFKFGVDETVAGFGFHHRELRLTQRYS